MDRKIVISAVAAVVLAVTGVGAYALATDSSDSSQVQITASVEPDVSSTAPATGATAEPTAQPATTNPAVDEECLSVQTANGLLMEAFPAGEGPTPLTTVECLGSDGFWAIGTSEGADGQWLFFNSSSRGWLLYRTRSYWAEDQDTCRAVHPRVREKLLGCEQF
jgi:hypothetical protein